MPDAWGEHQHLQPAGPGIPEALQGAPTWGVGVGGIWCLLQPAHPKHTGPLLTLLGAPIWAGWADQPGLETVLPAGSQEGQGGR